MSDEAAFLNAILASPADDAPRLVYADWLDERGDPESEAKAAFLRNIAAISPSARRRPQKAACRRLQQSALALAGNWLAVVGKSPIRACGPKLRRRCPKRWELLKTTSDLRVRFCDQCRKTIHFCDTLDDAVDNARHGRRVALHTSVPTRDLSRYPALVGVFRRTGQPRHEQDDEFDTE